MFARTPQQQAFVTELLVGTSHVALRARAGTGKSTTIIEAADELLAAKPHLEVDILMYNKAIAEDVTAKIKRRAAEQRKPYLTDWKHLGVGTMHSRGFALVRRTLGDVKIDDKKVRAIVDAMDNSEHHDIVREYAAQIVKLVGLAKGEGFGFFADRPIHGIQAWFDMADHYDVNGIDDEAQMGDIVRAAIEAYERSLRDTATIDFDDMILFPLIKNMRVRFGKDVIFVDEAQDLSRTRQALARKFLKYGTGRLVIVGDDRQAIYGFSGADADAMENLISEMQMKVLPLTTTFRCPTTVVAEAQRLVPDYQAGPDNGEGLVQSISQGEVNASLDSGAMRFEKDDAILCRNTAPLIDIAYGLIRRGMPCKVEGRAIGEGLINLCRRWKVATTAALSNRLDAYQEREVQKAMARNDDAKADAAVDKCQTLRTIIQQVNQQGSTTVQAVIDFINNLFADDVKGVTTLCTYHRSKGREWPRVWLWEHAARCPSRAAKQEWQVVQEGNLAYVAITRAMRELTFVQ